MVDLELYRIFKVVAEEENITHASEKLNISQPAVTKHIQNLEEILNIKLFERTNKGLILTKIGKDIYDEIREPIGILENLYKKYSDSRDINLGIHTTMLNKLFSKKLSKYYELNENAKINIVNYDVEDMLSKLLKQELDIVITKKISSYENENIEFIKIGTLQDILVVSKDSELLNKKISIEELKEKTLYMPRKTSVTSINFLKSLNLKENDFKNIKNISYNTMLEIIKNTNGIGLMTREYIKNELENNEIIKLETMFKIEPIEYGVYINNKNRFNAFKELIKLIENDMLV